MGKYHLLALILAGLLICSCDRSVDEISYCDPEDKNWNKGTWRIDLARKYVYGQDVSSFIGTIEHGSFIGFDTPFPILLFDNSVDRSRLTQEIESENYKFRFISPEPTHSDWWIIVATINAQSGKRNEESPRTNAKILYSIQDGVLSISLSSNLKPVINLVPCTNRTLKYRDIKSVVNPQKKG